MGAGCQPGEASRLVDRAGSLDVQRQLHGLAQSRRAAGYRDSQHLQWPVETRAELPCRVRAPAMRHTGRPPVPRTSTLAGVISPRTCFCPLRDSPPVQCPVGPEGMVVKNRRGGYVSFDLEMLGSLWSPRGEVTRLLRFESVAAAHSAAWFCGSSSFST